LGYCKIGNRKGLSLRVVEFSEDRGEVTEEVKDIWLFNDAPREIRLRAIEHIPDLIEELAKDTERMATRVVAKSGIASTLAEAINAIADDVAPDGTR
jgi:L-lactate utilization protein LutB